MNLIHKPLSWVLCNYFVWKVCQATEQLGIDPCWRALGSCVLMCWSFCLTAGVWYLWFNFPSYRAWQWKECKWVPYGERAVFLAHTAMRSIWNVTFFCALLGSLQKDVLYGHFFLLFWGTDSCPFPQKKGEVNFVWQTYIYVLSIILKLASWFCLKPLSLECFLNLDQLVKHLNPFKNSRWK